MRMEKVAKEIDGNMSMLTAMLLEVASGERVCVRLAYYPLVGGWAIAHDLTNTPQPCVIASEATLSSLRDSIRDAGFTVNLTSSDEWKITWPL
jgi:hypothetical protein